MSAQPNVDKRQIQRNRMKLAMAVGDKRHYVIDSIMPRHFLQTAEKFGIPATFVRGIMDEIAGDADRAIDAALRDLPPGFPASLTASIVEGLRPRLRLLAHATAAAY